MKKRIVSLFVLTGLSLQILSCAAQPPEETDRPDPDAGIDAALVTDQAEATEEEEPALPPFPHEIRTFDGAEFTILVDQEDGNLLDVTDFDSTEFTGEELHDAVYRRNIEVGDMLDLSFKAIHAYDLTQKVTTAVTSNTDDFDAVMPRLLNAGALASQGMCAELSGLHELSLDMPWWDKNTTNDLSIGNKVYVIAGDIFYKHYDGVPILTFNKRLMADLNRTEPYDLVREGTWTLDTFNEMVHGVKQDLDGNGVYDRNDLFGFATQLDYLESMLNAVDVKYVRKDENDLPYFSINNEHTLEALEKIRTHYVEDTWCAHRDGKCEHLCAFWMFPTGHSLFYWGMARYINLSMRDMEDEFGILPLPKYDETQERYYHLPNNYHSYAYILPKSAASVEDSAYISDVLAYYGKKYIQPAYYDSCLTRKYVRDEASADMLDVIFTTMTYDLGVVYSIGQFPGRVGEMLKADKLDFASVYKKTSKIMDKMLDKLVNAFQNIES